MVAPESLALYKLLMSWHLAQPCRLVDPIDELGVDEMSTYSPVDELTLLMKLSVDVMAVDESPPHHFYFCKISL